MKFIETQVFADSFNMKISKLDRWIRDGKIPSEYIRKVGRKLIIRTDAPMPNLKPDMKGEKNNG